MARRAFSHCFGNLAHGGLIGNSAVFCSKLGFFGKSYLCSNLYKIYMIKLSYCIQNLSPCFSHLNFIYILIYRAISFDIIFLKTLLLQHIFLSFKIGNLWAKIGKQEPQGALIAHLSTMSTSVKS